MLMYAGTQRAGSTWIRAVLDASGLSSSPEKEWHYWDRALGMRDNIRRARTDLGHPPDLRELTAWSTATLRPAGDVPLASLPPLTARRLWFKRWPDRRARARHALRGGLLRRSALGEWASWMRVWDIGDFTPDNVVLSRRQWAEIADALPDLRVIVSVRDPVQRLLSNLRRYLGKGLLVGELTPEAVLAYVALPTPHRASFASRTLEDVRAAFPAERVLVLCLDDIVESSSDVLDRLGAFVGRRLHDLPARNVTAASPVPGGLEEALQAHFAVERSRLEAAIGRPLAR